MAPLAPATLVTEALVPWPGRDTRDDKGIANVAAHNIPDSTSVPARIANSDGKL
jgi:hypothetical protein